MQMDQDYSDDSAKFLVLFISVSQALKITNKCLVNELDILLRALIAVAIIKLSRLKVEHCKPKEVLIMFEYIFLSITATLPYKIVL